MRFFIDNEAGDNFEAFDTIGHVAESNVSAHLDAMKIAASWGYDNGNGYFLHTEDGFMYEIVNPLTHADWANQMAYETGVLRERAA